MTTPPSPARHSLDAAPPCAVPLRIRHVDSLRAVAAGLVMWTHFRQTLAPISGQDPAVLGFLHSLPLALDIGRLGVMIFFAISGFVICRSFGGPRQGGGWRFLIKRFCRLYPAFWASILGGIVVWWLTDRTLTWPMLAANVTMAPGWLGQERILGVYWTLEIELIFYGACLGLYWLRCLERPAVLAGCALMLVSLPRGLKVIGHATGLPLGVPLDKITVVFGLAVMFWGAVFRLVYDETGGFRREVFRRPGTWLLVLLTLALVDVPDPNVKWALLGLKPGHWPFHFIVVYALAIFTLWVACLRVDHPVMTYLGVISYSLYLFHPIPQFSLEHLLLSNQVVSGWRLPFCMYLLLGVSLAVALAAGVYHWVERPAIALGKRWAGPGRDSVVTSPRLTPSGETDQRYPANGS